MGRVAVLLLLLVGLVWWITSRIQRRSGESQTHSRPKADSRTAEAPAVQDLVVCAHCGLHLPRAEALQGSGPRWFCSNEHRRLGPRTAGAGADEPPSR